MYDDVMGYQQRIVDSELNALFPHVAALALDGAKGIGKTTTAQQRVADLVTLDSPSVREAVEADPAVVLERPRPLLIDEWQRVPAVWDTVRRAVDQAPEGGQFLLTGSATPHEGATTHSGAGRIGRVRMRPMTLTERWSSGRASRGRVISEPTVSLGELLSGNRTSLHGTSDFRLSDYVDEILASGFPALRGLDPRALRFQLDSYLRNIVDRDVPEQGVRVRKPESLLAWLRAYAAATATTASYTEILNAATPGQADKPARSTSIAYRDVLTSLWLLDPIPAWIPSPNMLSRLTESPKHHLVDPALAARLLGLTKDALIAGDGVVVGPQSGNMLGHLFESLTTLCVRVLAQALEAQVAHLRTFAGQHEIDLIVIRDDGRVLAIEVKLSGTVSDQDTKHLRWLKRELGEGVLDAIVIHTGPTAYRRSDGIGVVPLALLGL